MNSLSAVSSVFGLVVVDVVLDDDAALGRLAGLAGAQDDADGLVLDARCGCIRRGRGPATSVSMMTSSSTAAMSGLLAHQDAALGRGIGRQDFQRGAVQIVVAQRKAGALMHRG